MDTRRTIAALAAAAGLASCGPTTVNITTTSQGGAEDSSGSTTGHDATSGLGASESSVGLDTSAGTDSSTTGDVGGGSSSGEPPPICVDPLTGACSCQISSGPFGCFCGDVEVAPAYCVPPCAVDDMSERCECSGAPADPLECGCFFVDDACWCGIDCPNGDCSEWPPTTCLPEE